MPFDGFAAGEIQGLSEQYRQGGIRRLVLVVDARSRRPSSSLYLVTTPAGEGLAGNVGSLTTGILETPGWTETVYRRLIRLHVLTGNSAANSTRSWVI